MATKPAEAQKPGQKQGVGQEKDSSQPSHSSSNPLAAAYYSVEDRYYSLLDYLEDERNIPVYEKFVEPIESRAIPSFPVAIFAVILVLAALFGIAAFLFAPGTATVTVSLVSSNGGSVNNASITLFLDNADTGDRIGSKISDDRGVAVFEKVPLGVQLWASVTAPDFADYSQPLPSISADAPYAQIELEPLAPTSSKFSLLVRDEGNLPVLGAKVTVHAATGALLENGIQLTNAVGAAMFTLPSPGFIAIDVEKDGFASVYNRLVDTSHSSTATITLVKDVSGPRTVTVIAVAENSTGDAVSAEVALSTAAGTDLGTKRTLDGRASFDVPQGTEFYISATATGSDSEKYFDYYSDRLVAQADVNEFSLKFVSKGEANGSCGTLRVSVKDESGKLLAADVSLYFDSTNAFVARKPTQSGTASFVLCADSTLYASAYAHGYFAANALDLKPGTSATITLRAITGDNNGSAEITTIDYDEKTPVPGAIISILGDDKRFLAYPKQSTNADGRAVFSELEIGSSYYAFAEKPSRSAWSGLFSITAGAAAKVTIVFARATAKITVAPVDILTGKPVDALANASASGIPSVSCQVSTSNTTACELTVYSDVPVTVEVTGLGYEKLTSSPFVLSEAESVRYTASLLPSALKNEFIVQYAGLFDLNGNNVTSSVERGGQYNARYFVNIPANASTYNAGFILRVGTAGFENRSVTDPLEHFAIIPGDYPKAPATQLSYSFQPSASCSSDLRNSLDDANQFKWAYYPLDNASGSREIVARVAVDAGAYTDEKLRVFSAAWYDPSRLPDSYLHIPVDSDFGSRNHSATRDWCYAKSDYREYSVSSGKAYCASSACVSIGFYNSDSNQTEKYTGIFGRPFFAQARVDLLRAVPSPRIVISSSSQKAQIHGYNISTDAQNLSGDGGALSGLDLNLTRFYRSATITLNVTFSDKASSTFYADFYDGNTKLARATGYVTQNGFGTLSIKVVPLRMNASGTYTINVSLSNSSSMPVVDALVWLNETNGTSLSGFKYSVLGGSVSDPAQGVSGNYSISGVLASGKGAFDVVATQPDYLDAKKKVVVDGIDFLSVYPSDIEACGEDNRVELYNSHVLDANVSLTVSKAGCVSVSAFFLMRNGTDTSWSDNTSQIIHSGLTYFMPLPYQSRGRIILSPATWDQNCSVIITASTRDGSQSTRSIAYSNCPQFASNEFLSVSPSRVSNTGVNGRCNLAAMVNVSNNLSSPGSVSIQAYGPNLTLDFGGSNHSLSTPFVFSALRGGKLSLRVYPTVANSSTALSFNATDGSRKANVVIPFDNCIDPVSVAAPVILSYSPKDYAKITTEKVSVLVSVDKYAYCRIGPSNVNATKLPYLLSQKSFSGSSYGYGIDLNYNNGAGSPFAFSKGQDTVYVGCCNPSFRGGKCTTLNAPVRFDFQYATPTPTPPCSGGGTSPSGVPGGSSSPTPSSTPTPTPSPTPVPAANVVTYRTDTNSFYLNGAPLSPAEVTVSLSSLLPVAGFVLRVDNSRKAVGEVIPFNSLGSLGVFQLDGQKLSVIDVPASGVTDVLVTFPDMSPAVLDSNSWGAGAGYTQDGSGQFKFSALPATLTLMPPFGVAQASLAVKPDVVTTDNFTFSGAVFETTKKVFVPYAQDLRSFDSYYLSPRPGESYSLLIFSNSLLSSSYQMGVSDSQTGTPAAPAASGYPLTNDDLKNNKAFSIWPVYLAGQADTQHKSGRLTVPLLQMALFADPLDTGGKLVTYSDMLTSANQANQGANQAVLGIENLRQTYSDLGQADVFGSAMANALHVGNGNGAFPDLLLAAEEGAVIHILWLQYDEASRSYSLPEDVTPVFEYPTGVESGAAISNLKSPYQKYILAYPGQKRYTAYYCPYTTDPSLAKTPKYLCDTHATSLDYGDFYHIGTADETSALSYLSSVVSVYTGSNAVVSGAGTEDVYVNPVSNSKEKNPLLKCDSKVSRNGYCIKAGSSDACVITASDELFYVLSKDERAYSIDQCKGNQNCVDCFGHKCDATHLLISNFNGGDSKLGFDPYALTHEAERCFDYPVTNYVQSGECTAHTIPTPPDCCTACGITWVGTAIPSPNSVACGGCNDSVWVKFPSCKGGVAPGSCLKINSAADACDVWPPAAGCGDSCTCCPSSGSGCLPTQNNNFPPICQVQSSCAHNGGYA